MPGWLENRCFSAYTYQCTYSAHLAGGSQTPALAACPKAHPPHAQGPKNTNKMHATLEFFFLLPFFWSLGFDCEMLHPSPILQNQENPGPGTEP